MRIPHLRATLVVGGPHGECVEAVLGGVVCEVAGVDAVACGDVRVAGAVVAQDDLRLDAAAVIVATRLPHLNF